MVPSALSPLLSRKPPFISCFNGSALDSYISAIIHYSLLLPLLFTQDSLHHPNTHQLVVECLKTCHPTTPFPNSNSVGTLTSTDTLHSDPATHPSPEPLTSDVSTAHCSQTSPLQEHMGIFDPTGSQLDQSDDLHLDRHAPRATSLSSDSDSDSDHASHSPRDSSRASTGPKHSPSFEEHDPTPQTDRTDKILRLVITPRKSDTGLIWPSSAARSQACPTPPQSIGSSQSSTSTMSRDTSASATSPDSSSDSIDPNKPNVSFRRRSYRRSSEVTLQKRVRVKRSTADDSSSESEDGDDVTQDTEQLSSSPIFTPRRQSRFLPVCLRGD